MNLAPRPQFDWRVIAFVLFLDIVFQSLAGCKKETPSESTSPVLLSGRWGGGSSAMSIDVTITESGGNLSGSGTLKIADGRAYAGTHAGTVSGSHAHPHVSLTLVGSGFPGINFTGKISDTNTIGGSVNGAGFSNLPFTFKR